MNKIALILMMFIVSISFIPSALGDNCNFITITDHNIIVDGTGTIRGNFTVTNPSVYNYSTYSANINLKSTGTISYDPDIYIGTSNVSAYETIIMPYLISNIQGTGSFTSIVPQLRFQEIDSTSKCGNNMGTPALVQVVDDTVPEFSFAVLPLLLSLMIFGIIKRK